MCCRRRCATRGRLAGLIKRVDKVEATVAGQGEAVSAARRDLAVQTARVSTLEAGHKILTAEIQHLKSDSARRQAEEHGGCLHR